jgi:hypothetical protein
MDLRERYLLAVKFFLPRPEQDDIIQELSDDIRSKIEATEAERGRPLHKTEQLALIKQYGHPALVAGRYGPQRYLIGPAVFPHYWFTLKAAVSSLVVVNVIISMVRLGTGTPLRSIVRVAALLPPVALGVFGVVTLVFAFLDRRWVTRAPE